MNSYFRKNKNGEIQIKINSTVYAIILYYVPAQTIITINSR